MAARGSSNNECIQIFGGALKQTGGSGRPDKIHLVHYPNGAASVFPHHDHLSCHEVSDVRHPRIDQDMHSSLLTTPMAARGSSNNECIQIFGGALKQTGSSGRPDKIHLVHYPNGAASVFPHHDHLWLLCHEVRDVRQCPPRHATPSLTPLQHPSRRSCNWSPSSLARPGSSHPFRV